MTVLRVSNRSHRAKAFKVIGGLKVVKAGQTETIENARELTDAQIAALARQGVKVRQSSGAAPERREPASSTRELKAVHRGGGSYSVMRGDVEVVEKLSKDDAAAFNEMSAEDRESYVSGAAG